MKLDNFLVSITISIFILAGLFNLSYVLYANSGSAFNLEGLVTAGFLGWATFYAGGNGLEALKKGVYANLSGVFWAVIIVLIWGNGFGFNTFGAFLSVAIGAAMMCFQAHWKPFAFIPGAFIGCSTFFALGASITGTTLYPAILGLLIGLLLGFVSEKFAISINSKVFSK